MRHDLSDIERIARDLVRDFDDAPTVANIMPIRSGRTSLAARLRELRLAFVQLDQARAREVSP